MASKFFSPGFCFLMVLSTAFRAAASGLGAPPADGFRSPEGDARFSAEQGARPLNNLVFELLNRDAPGAAELPFRNPREGWVYIGVLPGGDEMTGTIELDGELVALKRVGDTLEGMRYATEGPHRVQLADGMSAAKRVEVRAIGELVYATYGLNPHIEETGVYSWEFLRTHCLDNFNSIIGLSSVNADESSTQESEIRDWTGEGKRWFTTEEVPYDASSADEAYAHWAESPGMQHPLMSGIWADEFGVGEKYGKKTSAMYPIWIDAIRRLRANPAFANRTFYAYGPSRLLPEERFAEMYPFFQALAECGYGYGPEWYLPEAQSRPGRIIEKTGDLLAEFSPGWEQASRASFEKANPGAATNRVVVVGLLSEPGWESSDIFPGYDFNVFLDSEMQFIATDPSFFGVRGLQGYLSSYCGEEQTRLFAKLVRHYAIEGNTGRYLADPYVLPHIQNPDLAGGTVGWALRPAITDTGQETIALKNVPGFGTLQARYHAPEGTGDVAFWTRRSEEGPNFISQTIQELTPGRLYSLRLITGDFREFNAGTSLRRQHAVSVMIDNVDRLEARSFQAVVGGAHWYSHGAFNAGNPYWLNYHQLVFRARSNWAELRLSDWISETNPGGPVGEEFLWNFFQVQPYVE